MEENQIIKGCKKKDRRAQKAFVDQYSGYLYTICRRYVIEDFAAQDCLQTSLVQVLTHIDKYQEVGTFKAWIAKISVRKCLEYIRKNKKHRHDELDGIAAISEGRDVLYELELQDVMAFLATLPHNYRVAINMYLVEGYSHKEIGEHLGVNESSSRSLVARARKMIQEKFESERLTVVHKHSEIVDRSANKNIITR